jgi:hypothetical protein
MTKHGYGRENKMYRSIFIYIGSDDTQLIMALQHHPTAGSPNKRQQNGNKERNKQYTVEKSK